MVGGRVARRHTHTLNEKKEKYCLKTNKLYNKYRIAHKIIG